MYDSWEMTTEVALWTLYICAHTFIQIFTHMCTNTYMLKQHYHIPNFILIKGHYPNKINSPPSRPLALMWILLICGFCLPRWCVEPQIFPIIVCQLTTLTKETILEKKGGKSVIKAGDTGIFFMPPPLLASNKWLGLLLWWQEHSTGFDCPLSKLMLKCHCFYDGIEERNI